MKVLSFVDMPKPSAPRVKKENKGEIFEASVRDIASDGRAVVNHPSGRTCFVEGLWLGEKAKLKITSLKSQVGFAECVELLEPSVHRIIPPCGHHGFDQGQCGACPWQFVPYVEQLRVKQKNLRERFERIGISDEIREIWPSDTEYGYRNHAQFKTDGKKIGYVSSQSNAIAPIKDCLILSDKNRETFAHLQDQLPNKDWRPLKTKRWTTIDIDESTLYESASINQRLPFLQAHSTQNARMREWLATKLDLIAKDSEVLELFSGSGNFTEIIAEKGFKKVFAVEVVEEALAELNLRELNNVETVRANLFQESGVNIALSHAKGAEVLVLDPPREGLKVPGDLFSKKIKIREVFYVSCDPATLLRDIRKFRENGYVVKEVQPLDQFPHTPHVEVLVHMSKLK